jgi:subtilisin family serine protease
VNLKLHSPLYYPARQTVLFYHVAVAGSNAVDGLWSSSNYGKTTITLAAPAIYIVTTSNANASAYQLFSGTSAATPIVAGAIALMYAVKPGASYQQIRYGPGPAWPADTGSKAGTRCLHAALLSDVVCCGSLGSPFLVARQGTHQPSRLAEL